MTECELCGTVEELLLVLHRSHYHPDVEKSRWLCQRCWDELMGGGPDVPDIYCEVCNAHGAELCFTAEGIHAWLCENCLREIEDRWFSLERWRKEGCDVLQDYI